MIPPTLCKVRELMFQTVLGELERDAEDLRESHGTNIKQTVSQTPYSGRSETEERVGVYTKRARSQTFTHPTEPVVTENQRFTQPAEEVCETEDVHGVLPPTRVSCRRRIMLEFPTHRVLSQT